MFHMVSVSQSILDSGEFHFLILVSIVLPVATRGSSGDISDCQARLLTIATSALSEYQKVPLFTTRKFYLEGPWQALSSPATGPLGFILQTLLAMLNASVISLFSPRLAGPMLTTGPDHSCSNNCPISTSATLLVNMMDLCVQVTFCFF